MMSIEQIREALQDRRVDMIAAYTGVSYSTVQALRSGANRNPTAATVEALSGYLLRGEKTTQEEKEA